jgi:hypothetical protein
MVIARQRLGPWRAALNWNCAVFLLGSLAACVPTLLVVAPFVVLYPDGPPRAVGWCVLRLTQLMQCVVIAWAGGKLALWYFHLTPSPNPEPGLVRESSCPEWGWMTPPQFLYQCL